MNLLKKDIAMQFKHRLDILEEEAANNGKIIHLHNISGHREPFRSKYR